MRHNALRDAELALLFSQLQPEGPNLEESLQMMQAIRARSPEWAARLDRRLLEELARLRNDVSEASGAQAELRRLIEKLTCPPHFPAVLLGFAAGDSGPAAMVLYGSTRRVVALAKEADLAALEVGDEVLLSHELNTVLSKSPFPAWRCGETAAFERVLEDGRLVLRSRDEELVVEAAGALEAAALRSGDEVRYDRNAWLAFEKIERSEGGHMFLEETPSETFDHVGGLDREIEELQRTFRLHLEHPEIVKKYLLPRKKSVLFEGPPGTGKTLLARALANWLARLSRAGRSRFMNVKPGQWGSVWYSQTEANCREAFRVAREAGEQDPAVPVVMFLDEIDSIGASRGQSYHRIDDRVLNVLMAELNGLESRGNVVVVAATNRRDVLDPALLRPGRLGDLVLRIRRPDRKAGRDIFSKHLRPEIPYRANGEGPAGAREILIDSALAQLYSPNGEAEVAVITFRDSQRRAVRARDLISGAEIARIAQIALERACLRESNGGPSGVELGDVLAGVAQFFRSAATALTPSNCRLYLDDLPQDVDVVRVEPVVRRVAEPHRYLNQG